nr:penicillin-binding protein 1C [Calditrichia bacterium]
LITILYPQQGSHLWVPRDFGGLRQKIVFRAAHQDRQSYLYWYLNDHYLGSTQYRHELAVSPEKGWQELQIVDNNGVRTRSRFFVDSR